jgi:hypothetical protein
MQRRGAVFAKQHTYLLILLFVAFIFRFSGVFWGLPPFDAKSYHPDETKIVTGAYRFPGEIEYRHDLRYPTAYHYTLGVLTWPIKKVLESTGYGSYAYVFVYMTGRLLSVLLGTTTVLLVYLLTRFFFKRVQALVAAFALAFSMFHVTNSAWVTTDVLTSFWMTLFLLLLALTIDRQSLYMALYAGIALGMLVGTKYIGAFAVLPLFMLIFAYQKHRHRNGLWRQGAAFCTDKILWVVGIAALCVFFLTTPGILLHADAFLSSMQFEQARLAQRQFSLYDISVWRNVFATLCRTMGWPLAVSAVFGLCLSCASRKAFEIAIAALAIMYVLCFRNALAHVPRYWIMLMPVLAVFAARSIMLFHSSKRSWLRVTGIFVSSVILLHAFWYSACAIVSRYPDTRSIASQYINEKIPPGSTIGIAYRSARFGWRTHDWVYPKINFGVLHYVDFLEKPEFLVVSSYDANQILQALKSGLLNADFSVPPYLVNQWYQSSPPSPEIFKFYNNLYFSDDAPYELIQKFRPRRLLVPIEFPPPVIEIFRRKQRERAIEKQESLQQRSEQPCHQHGLLP